MSKPPFEPLEILAVLEKHRVAYVVIGKLAGIIHGTGGIADGVEICPQMKESNLVRLQRALDELDARTEAGRASADPSELAGSRALLTRTPLGELTIVPDPPGTRGGWDDVRRRASREPLGDGIRAPTAAIEDLVRIEAAHDAAESAATLAVLRQVAEVARNPQLGR